MARYVRMLVTAVFALTVVSLVSATVGARAGSKEPGGKDPCEQLSRVPGKAVGLQRKCEDPGGGSGIARADFNGDGFGDLAVGIPHENVGSAVDAGAVQILYGSANGLTATGNQFFTQNTSGMIATSQDDDFFGATLVAFDYNADNYSDLAVGSPSEGGDHGVVHILLGSATGLAPYTYTTFGLITGQSSCGCRFGSALTWGDFDHDGKADLAIGMRTYKVAGIEAGGVLVRFGSGSYQIIQYPGSNRTDSNSSFGMTLAGGDHDADGFSDLAVGAPLETGYLCGVLVTCIPMPEAGFVRLYRGRAAGGLLYTKKLSQSDAAGNWGGAMGPGEQFGRALAFGDIDHDTRAELVVGAPYDDEGGAVSIFFGEEVPYRFHQTIFGGQSGSQYGRALAVKDLDGDGFAELAVGAPGYDIGNPTFFATYIQDAGMVEVFHGGYYGPETTAGAIKIWHQDTSGVPGAAEAGDQFGAALSAWDFDHDFYRDLAIGVPLEDVGGISNAGAIIVLYGSSHALSTSRAQLWHQDLTGVLDAASAGDRFGSAVY
jgi:hypothetical protein